MTRTALRLGTGLLAATALALVHAAAANASELDGHASGDAIEIRGIVELEPESVLTTAAASTPSTRITNCVSIGNGQLRCYTTDLAAGVLDGITATSVVPADAGPTAGEVAATVASEFRRLPLRPSGIVLQPSRGWVLVNLDTIVLTDPTPQTFDISVLGTPVEVRATPAGYAWDFGDGSPPLVTNDPGAPWPEPTLTHAYRSPGTRTITLTTQWRGEFRAAGSATWQPIDGVATTSASAPPVEVRVAENALVSSP